MFCVRLFIGPHHIVEQLVSFINRTLEPVCGFCGCLCMTSTWALVDWLIFCNDDVIFELDGQKTPARFIVFSVDGDGFDKWGAHGAVSTEGCTLLEITDFRWAATLPGNLATAIV
jgi:hypothetical protein